MEMVCGTCRQFSRAKSQQKNLCNAWGNPTTMTRVACEFWMPKSMPIFQYPKEANKGSDEKCD
ncbi:hypothetical protein VTH8203_01863 [Vibrio thalassae]|uniref:Uncharacterized protein n=1 Tax=Vibrio thalassae TaxID=1243014 RepID=A0A240EJS9_9VIBR|nr:hypothetical protein [Vibrio thalassae]SNX48245.1 hypothetical protein VTH8203_01863 [Vibrio thalassae]